jgi:PilZ domain
VRGPQDRRAAERIPVTSDTHCNFLSPVVEDFGPGKIRNVSTDGIGLLLSRQVEPGTLLAVGLANAAKGFARTVLVRVVHVTPQPGGSFLIGGTFSTPLTYEELRNLVM